VSDVSTTVAPCSLLTVEQVSAALGDKVNPGAPIYATGCSWHAATAQTAVTVKFESVEYFSALKTRDHAGIVRTAVTGLGDDAFFLSLGATANLTVKKGSQSFTVRVYGVKDVAKEENIEKAIAKGVIAKL
jgi:hypothetical protein